MMNTLGIGTKIASALGMSAIALEAHSNGKRVSKNSGATARTDKFVRDSIGASKLEYVSSRHNATKSFIANADISDRILEFGGKIRGYVSGFGKTVWNNIFTVAFGAVGLTAKSKPAKIIALIGLGLSLGIDTILNGTNLFERKDYLDK